MNGNIKVQQMKYKKLEEQIFELQTNFKDQTTKIEQKQQNMQSVMRKSLKNVTEAKKKEGEGEEIKKE